MVGLLILGLAVCAVVAGVGVVLVVIALRSLRSHLKQLTSQLSEAHVFLQQTAMATETYTRNRLAHALAGQPMGAGPGVMGIKDLLASRNQAMAAALRPTAGNKTEAPGSPARPAGMSMTLSEGVVRGFPGPLSPPEPVSAASQEDSE